MTLTKNVGKMDRNIRLVAGGMFVFAALLFSSMMLKLIMTLVGLVLLATGATGVCPAYMPLKVNTIKDGEA